MTDHLPSNKGHGHVFPRADGVKARCGGPSICHVCAIDLGRKRAQESVAAAEPLPSKDQFQPTERLWLDGSTCEVAESYDRTMIYVGDLTLDMKEALALRGWLEKVIPTQPPGDG